MFLDLQKKLNHKKKYDNIVVFNVLEHLNNLDSSLQNLFSLLKKGGRVRERTSCRQVLERLKKKVLCYSLDRNKNKKRCRFNLTQPKIQLSIFYSVVSSQENIILFGCKLTTEYNFI